jgi:hypothetical protein
MSAGGALTGIWLKRATGYEEDVSFPPKGSLLREELAARERVLQNETPPTCYISKYKVSCQGDFRVLNHYGWLTKWVVLCYRSRW